MPKAVAEALEKATESIYIADWWLSPELVRAVLTFIHPSLIPVVPKTTAIL